MTLLAIPHWTDFAERMSTTELILVIANLILLLASRWLTDWLAKVGPRGRQQSPASVQFLPSHQRHHIRVRSHPRIAIARVYTTVDYTAYERDGGSLYRLPRFARDATTDS